MLIKRRFPLLIALSAILLIVQSGCWASPQSAARYSSNTPASSATPDVSINTEWENTGAETTWQEAMPEDIPEPPGVTKYIKLNGHFECQGLSAKDFDDYLLQLKSAGFKTAAQSSIYYSLINDRYWLSITDQSYCANSYIMIGYTKIKSDATLLPGELSASEAKARIQSYISEISDKESRLFGKSVDEIVQLDQPEVWGKMGTQVFIAFTMGDFLIYGDHVEPVFASGNLKVVDLDHDGEYELINLAGWGSGIYRYEMIIYKKGRVLAENCWVPDAGFAGLTLEQIDENTVLLRGFEYKSGSIVLKENFGKLMLEDSNGTLKPVPEYRDNFPYKEWGELYKNYSNR